VPKDGTATRERILDAAEKLVIDNGYAATSVDHVIAASSSSKGAFFHHFDTKLDLARALVDRYAAADVTNLHAAMEHAYAATDDPVGRVDAFLEFFEDAADEIMSAQTSCLYVSMLTERQLVLDGTAEPIVKAIIAWREGIAGLLRDATAGRTVQIDLDALADHVFVTFEGAFLLARSTGDTGHMRAQLRTLRQLVAAALA
jgi:TetR/AcrR family transcriptional regulator, transcriptional repressor for nem operon